VLAGLSLGWLFWSSFRDLNPIAYISVYHLKQQPIGQSRIECRDLLLIQILPPNTKETKTEEDQIVIILQQFFPDKFQLGSPVEITVDRYEKFSEFKVKVSKTIDIPQKQLSVAITDYSDLGKILSIPNLSWYPTTKEERSLKKKSTHKITPNITLSSLSLEDGSTIFCRDLSVPLKKLTAEEEKTISDIDAQIHHAKWSPRHHKKEECLDITIQDVSIIPSPTKKNQ